MSAKTELAGLKLRFSNPDTERDFLKFFEAQFIVQFRAAMILGMVLILMDALVDYLVAPAAAMPGNLIRILFVDSIFIILLAGSFTHFLRAHFQAYVCVVFSIGSIGLLYAVELIAETHAPIITTWVGIVNYFFIIIFSFLIMGLRLLPGAIAGAAVTIGYLCVMAVTKDLDVARFIYSTYHIATIYILGLFLGYVRELYVRRDFAAQTQLREGQESLRAAKDAADRASHAKSEFLATMSHELRTPMNGILGMTRLALTKHAVSDDLAQLLRTIERSGGLLKRLIDDVLDITRIEAGQLRVEQEPFALSALIEDIIEIVEPLALEQKSSIDWAIAETVPAQVVGDQAHVRQVLLNIVGNAVKFTQNGTISINVSAFPASGDQFRLVFTVRDTGIGIPPDELRLVFEPLTQATNTIRGRFGGTGLGLTIAKRLVTAMGGNLGVTSKLGKGSTFTIEIQVGQAGLRHDELPDNPRDESPATTPLSLLIVEDEPINQQVAKGLLELDGHAVTVVATGRAALAAVEQHRFDAILLDMRLPDLDGLEVARRLAELERQGGARTPIIVLTANVMPKELEAYRAAGLTTVVEKPIDPAKLSRAIGGHVGARERSDPHAQIPELFDRQQIGLIIDSFPTGRSVQLLGDLDASIRDSICALKSFLIGGKLPEMARRAHRLSGAALNFGLPALHQAAQALESSVEHGPRSLLEQRLAETEAAADAALQGIALLRCSVADGATVRAADGKATAGG